MTARSKPDLKAGALRWQYWARAAHQEAATCLSRCLLRSAISAQLEVENFSRRARANLFELIGAEPE